MWSAIWSVLGALAAGFVGWFVANFVAKPLLDFWSLRSQVHEEITFTANVGNVTGDRDGVREKAADSLRRLGAKMHAMDVTQTPARWLLSYGGNWVTV